MAQKILTSSVIKAISNKVSEQLSKEAKSLVKEVRNKITASKEWKQLLKLDEEQKELTEKKEKIKQEIHSKYSTPILSIDVFDNHVIVSESYRGFSSDRVRDMILIEEYLSDVSETPEELINRIVLKMKNG
jgi:bifunctional ADP-heptose synthase (sugar kinase/adenylyltransferase)